MKTWTLSPNPITIIHFSRVQGRKKTNKKESKVATCYKNKIEVNNWSGCAQRTGQKRHLKPILMIISAFLPSKMPAACLRTRNRDEVKRAIKRERERGREQEAIEISKIDGQHLHYYSWRLNSRSFHLSFAATESVIFRKSSEKTKR